MSNGNNTKRLFAYEPSGIRVEQDSSFVASGPQQEWPQQANVNVFANVSSANSLEDQETHISTTSRDPPTVEDEQRPNVSSSARPAPSQPSENEIIATPAPSYNYNYYGAATTSAPAAHALAASGLSTSGSSTTAHTSPSYKQQCSAAGPDAAPSTSGEPILVQANPVSYSQLLSEQDMEQQWMQRSNELKDPSREQQGGASKQNDSSLSMEEQRRRKLICCGVFGILLLLVAAIAVAGICGSGNCSSPNPPPPPSPTISLPRGLPLTPSPVTVATPTAPIVLTRESRLANLINDMTLSGGRIRYPLPSDPTPEEEALSWLIEDDPARLPASRTTQVVQRFVLAALWFNDVIPQTPEYTDSWLFSEDECDWEGVLSCSSGAVASLQITENTVAGRLPNDLGLLTALTRLVIVDNDLTGTIPSSIASLTQLTLLSLYENSLAGEIPDLSALTRLDSIGLYANGLVGTIPSGIASLTGLTYLGFHDNVLTGTIPNLESLSGLSILSFGPNPISGSIPSWIGSMTALTGLFFYDTRLRGSIPSEISSLSRLFIVRLDQNLLTGTIPNLSTLTDLTGLYLFDNALTGPIPRVESLTALRNFAVSTNGLTGALPEFAPRFMETLWLSDNRLGGSLPSSYGGMTNLEVLNLYNNLISSSIPGTFSGMTSLTQLALFGNPITGTIPIELQSLTALTDIYLFNTDITGPVPFCNITGLPIDDLVLDCDEVECPCCSHCCPREGMDGIPGWNSPNLNEVCDA